MRSRGSRGPDLGAQAAPRSQTLRAERRVGAPYASDAPSQSMVGSLRSWLEKSRNEPAHPHRSRTRWRPQEPPTVESWHSLPGLRRLSERSWRPWLPPLRQRRALPPSARAGPPKPQPPRRLPQNDRSAGRARPQPPQPLRPSVPSAGPASPRHPRRPPSGPSADLASRPREQPPRRPSARSDVPGRVPSQTRHRHLAGSTDAARWGVRRSPEPNPDPLGQVSTGFG
jgi:hypothetical protein